MWKSFASGIAVLAFGAAGWSLWGAHRMQVGFDERLIGARIDVSQPGETRTSLNQTSFARYDDVLHTYVRFYFEPPVWGHLDLGGKIVVQNKEGMLVAEEDFSDPFAGNKGTRYPVERVIVAQFQAVPKGEYDVEIILNKGDPALADRLVTVWADHSFDGYYTFGIWIAKAIAGIFGTIGLLSIIPLLVSVARKRKTAKTQETP